MGGDQRGRRLAMSGDQQEQTGINPNREWGSHRNGSKYTSLQTMDPEIGQNEQKIGISYYYKMFHSLDVFTFYPDKLGMGPQLDGAGLERSGHRGSSLISGRPMGDSVIPRMLKEVRSPTAQGFSRSHMRYISTQLHKK